jgi:hypothetical protein
MSFAIFAFGLLRFVEDRDRRRFHHPHVMEQRLPLISWQSHRVKRGVKRGVVHPGPDGAGRTSDDAPLRCHRQEKQQRLFGVVEVFERLRDEVVAQLLRDYILWETCFAEIVR